MNPNSDTLNISPLRLSDELPIAEVIAAETSNDRNPEAAARARARISELTNAKIDPVIDSMVPPLITDKSLLIDKPSTHHNYPAKRRSIALPSRLKPIVIAIGFFGIVFLLFKAPVLYDQLTYNTSGAAPLTIPATGSLSANAPISPDPTIVIPKINVNAPVVYLGSTNEKDVLAGLQNGVVHYGNTPNPGEVGNSVFFGHSSNDWWEPGNYKFVFVLLDKLVVGDTFTINYNSEQYTYQVTETKVVSPADVSVLSQTSTPTVTLITCSPPGTSWNRLVVSAKQISPSGSGSTASNTSSAPSVNAPASLPSNSPGIVSQVSGFFTGLWNSIFQNKPAMPASPSTSSETPPATLPNAS